MALGKLRLTISSRRMGKISSERSAERRRSAADCFDNPAGTRTSDLAWNRGLAILPTPLITPILDTAASTTSIRRMLRPPLSLIFVSDMDGHPTTTCPF